MSTDKKRDTSTPVMALVFIAIGAVVLWDTLSYTDADSYVFPRTVAITMMGLSALLIAQWAFRFGPRTTEVSGGAASESLWRRVALVAAMLGAGLVMPITGFVISGAIAFVVILLAAMYDPWTPFRLAVYPLAGAGIVGGFYLLFSRVLQVPLPTGIWDLG